MSERPNNSLGSKVARAMIEGVVTAILFSAAVLIVGSMLGMQDRLAGSNTSLIIAVCGGLGLLLSGRLSVKTFDDRG